MQHPADRIIHSTAFVAPDAEHCLEREQRTGSIVKDQSDDPPHHERTLPDIHNAYVVITLDCIVDILNMNENLQEVTYCRRYIIFIWLV